VTFKKFYDKQSIQLNRRPKVIPHKTIDGVEHKRCSVCEEWKVLEEFHRIRSSPDGRYSQCRDCKSVYTKLYIKATVKERSLKRRLRAQKDPMFKILRNISGRIWSSLKRKKNYKKTLQILNYTPKELRLHLELQFESWMTWENYGNTKGCWSIDHIDPVTSFTITSLDCEDFKKCWALENLRPVSSLDNFSKNKFLLPYEEHKKAKEKALWAATIVRERTRLNA